MVNIITHRLKTDPEHFMAVFSGIKEWELRKNDRDFKVGQGICLVETEYSGEEMKNGKPLIFTGRTYTSTILHILHGPVYGLEAGYVILSI